MATERRLVLANPNPAEFFTGLCNMLGVTPIHAEGNSLSGKLTITFQRVTTGPVNQNKMPGCDGLRIRKVMYEDPAVIVFWSDNTKTVVRASVHTGEKYDPEKGLAMAIAKKCMGNKGNYYNEFKRWLKSAETEEK